MRLLVLFHPVTIDRRNSTTQSHTSLYMRFVASNRERHGLFWRNGLGVLEDVNTCVVETTSLTIAIHPQSQLETV